METVLWVWLVVWICIALVYYVLYLRLRRQYAKVAASSASQNKEKPPCLHRFVVYEHDVKCIDCNGVYDKFIG